ncbi:hypothetical protein [Agrobacterium tumefaciens]|uniref:hypothetical protein n=1 Tax=Agrobacterium tumefaciens TaxID=358 RepID=UPI001572E126|nr:hypothetical protein [Agrobacterium tumefaciens]NSY51929.1 hypothetical protein [Agrobacterium tumefaciens]NTC81496.1 hypothetical protein [Agrobacterium tumefaciens]NTD11077.1 hypothetical protein [Agrobacterium tumefaciens]WCK16482.1 hypothetical protein G6L41_023990 [Agrobacterium tumefaciens]
MTANGAQVTCYAAAKRCLLSGASHDGLYDRHEGAFADWPEPTPLPPFTMRADFPEAIIAGGALAVKVTTHAIEQRCHFRVLAQVDRAPEEEPMGRLVDAIG